ncbi:MAG: hypothetical protein ACRDWS_16450 [Acidimicrobiia bacterium]
MSINVFFDATRPTVSGQDQVSTLSAAYPDSSVAHAVIDDLERAGLRPTVIVPLGPWTVSSIPDPGGGLFEHPIRTAGTGALILGLITTIGSLIWLDGRQWLLYAALGLIVGALTGWVGSALAATAHPAREEDLLAHPAGGLTVEVEAEEAQQARLAEIVMGRHGPTNFQAWTRPGPRSPTERVMWQHEDGLSPLEALGSWLDEAKSSGAVVPRGRHLQADRLRP